MIDLPYQRAYAERKQELDQRLHDAGFLGVAYNREVFKANIARMVEHPNSYFLPNDTDQVLASGYGRNDTAYLPDSGRETLSITTQNSSTIERIRTADELELLANQKLAVQILKRKANYGTDYRVVWEGEDKVTISATPIILTQSM